MFKAKIVSVKFDYLQQRFFYDPGNFWVYKNLPVIVKKDDYLEYGFVTHLDKMNRKTVLPRLTRVATSGDTKKYHENKKFEVYAFELCKNKINKFGLKMKLIKSHLTFDGHKIIFLFTTEEHINFKLIVREMSHFLRVKIEFKYIGVRNEAANISAIGICGRALCCNKFLNRFNDISVSMAKEQGMPLHPVKISGNCGKLLCCLKYEQDTYDELKANAPKIGDTVQTIDGVGKVFKINLLTQQVKVSFKEENKNGDLFDIYKICHVKVIKKNNQDNR